MALADVRLARPEPPGGFECSAPPFFEARGDFRAHVRVDSPPNELGDGNVQAQCLGTQGFQLLLR